MSDEELEDIAEAEEYTGRIGCYRCDRGWTHGCCDDLCRGGLNGDDAFDCPHAQPCQCNPDEEIPN